MKRIKCTKCGRPRWARPAPGQGGDVRTRRPLQLMGGKPGLRDVMVSSLEATTPECLPCRRASEKKSLRPIRSKVFGEMTHVVVRKAKEETTGKEKRKEKRHEAR